MTIPIPRISLFIIAKNEETKLPKCIASARALVHEIIVVDGYSEDKTAQVARDLGAQVYQREFDGFASQKNFALSKVSCEWALNLDADETLSAELVEKIRTVLPGTAHAGFDIRFSNYLFGKQMKHSGLNKEHHLRLVRKQGARYEGGLVHEGLHIEGTVGRLEEPICHYSYDSIESYFRKFNKYTSLAARQIHQNGRKFHLWFILPTVPLEFLKRYVLKLGFLDGMRGFIWAAFSAFYVFVKYMKLWALEQRGQP